MRRVAGSMIIVVSVIAAIGLARAQENPPCSFEYICSTYLPILMTTAPPPPALHTLVLQPQDVPGFRVEESREITNTESALSYLDPAAALAAFDQQGRESSWYIRYLSRTRPIVVSSQAIRYETIEGADAGLDYAVANERASFPHYGALVSVQMGDRAVGCLAVADSNGTTFSKYFYAIRKGNMVTIVQTVAPSYMSIGDDAWEYAQKATGRLP